MKSSQTEDNEEQEVDIEDLDESESFGIDESPNVSNQNCSNSPNLSRNSAQLNQSNFQVQFSRKSKYNFSLNESVLYQDVLQVNCNSVLGELHKKKFGSGGKGQCIKVLVSVEDEEEEEEEEDGADDETTGIPARVEDGGASTCEDEDEEEEEEELDDDTDTETNNDDDDDEEEEDEDKAKRDIKISIYLE